VFAPAQHHSVTPCRDMARPSDVEHTEILNIFYTQKNIARQFHDGSKVDNASIQDDWVMHVTKTPNGQWFTLNNRLLYAHRQRIWADNDDPSGKHYMINILLPAHKVKIVPFKECAVDFRAKFTSIDNGNTCYIRSGIMKPEKDWICAISVNKDLYNSYVVPGNDPTISCNFWFCFLAGNDPTRDVHEVFLIRVIAAGLLVIALPMIFCIFWTMFRFRIIWTTLSQARPLPRLPYGPSIR
jgi:hypothetical protein